jgi:hypothetical protein
MSWMRPSGTARLEGSRTPNLLIRSYPALNAVPTRHYGRNQGAEPTELSGVFPPRSVPDGVAFGRWRDRRDVEAFADALTPPFLDDRARLIGTRRLRFRRAGRVRLRDPACRHVPILGAKGLALKRLASECDVRNATSEWPVDPGPTVRA